ncbi:ATP-binding protein [Cystobacter fuscus]|uniref:PAS domain-containing sensor histidine kinase n=1 Tax=Cystobacter fuscus TaxID=43 RepID=UPI0037BF2D44
MPSLSPDPTSGSRDRSGLPPDPPQPPDELLRASHQLLRKIVEIQSALIRGGNPCEALRRLLAEVMDATGSTSGCLVETLSATDGARGTRCLASLPADARSDEEPNQETRELRARVEALCASTEPLPAESTGTRCVLPLEVEGLRVGAVGLAGRPGGYEARLTDFLQPFLVACGALLMGERHEQRRSEAEKALRQRQQESAENLRLVMDNMEDGVWVLDLDTYEIFANHRWLGMLGYARGELEPTLQTWLNLCHPEDAARYTEALAKRQRQDLNAMEWEQRLRHRDGGWRWVMTRVTVVARDAQGRTSRLVGTNVDITVRKHGEERLRALVDMLPDLVFRIDADGTYRDHYITHQTDLAVPIDRIIGMNLRQLPVAPAYIDKIFQHLGRAIREGTAEVVEYPMERTQGRMFYEMRLMRSAPDEVVAIVRNITERKQTEERLRQQEEELRRHRDSLEELVRNRSEKLLRATLELEEQQAQLIQTEKMASLGQMAAGVAHEINNPVSYVMSNLGTLDQYVSALRPLLAAQRELLSAHEAAPTAPVAPELIEHMRELWEQGDVDYLLEDMPELVEESLAGTRRIKEIVQSLRSFAREDSGEPQLVDVNEELASTLKIVWNELKYKCEVKRDFGPLPPVSCHPTQISQVFTNLLVNAAQAIETRGEIRIRTRQEGGEVVVEIADTGKGMSAETLSKLFTPFFTTKPRGQGTGLGLSVSYGIITRHQGRIDVQSEPGKGSTFVIRLPAARAEANG